MKILDLTHTFTATMPVYRGDPASELKPFGKPGCMDHLLTTGMHVGTHMDGPLHMIENGKYLSDMPVEHFVGPGHLIDARGHDVIPASLFDGITIKLGSIVLLFTGHSAKFRSSDYFEKFPVISEEFAKKAVALGVKIVGMDTPSPDVPPFPVHKILLGSEILIIENLTNLESLIGLKNFTVAALPAKFHADAAPVRVVAMVK